MNGNQLTSDEDRRIDAVVEQCAGDVQIAVRAIRRELASGTWPQSSEPRPQYTGKPMDRPLSTGKRLGDCTKHDLIEEAQRLRRRAKVRELIDQPQFLARNLR